MEEHFEIIETLRGIFKFFQFEKPFSPFLSMWHLLTLFSPRACGDKMVVVIVLPFHPEFTFAVRNKEHFAIPVNNKINVST